MNIPSQDDLLGYVLGALDAQEHRDVQRLIDQNPEIEEQLLQIKSSLISLDCIETSGPPPGLARRTCESVAGWQNEQPFDSILDQPKPGFDSSIQSAFDVEAPSKPVARLRSSVSERFLHPKTWSIPDVLVGMALLAVVAGILFPSLAYTRYNNRIVACQYNLSQVGTALFKYSSAHEGQFVVIPRDGQLATIGCFAPILKDAGFLEDDSLLACAGIAANLPPVRVPSCEEVINACGTEQISHYHHTMCGHYGYNMGYIRNGQYYAPRNMGRSNVVLVADQPSPGLPGRVSANHSNRGQNCLFGDGSVGFVIGASFGDDPIYVNDYNVVAPGTDATDNVIALSHLSPHKLID